MRSKVVLATLLATFSIGWRSPDALIYPVNMTLAGDRLLVSDRYNGVHVYDVADPAAPEPRFVIPLSGNRGVAVKGDVVYANDRNHLLVIRLSGDTYEVVNEIELVETRPIDFEGWNEGRIGRDNAFGCDCDRAQDAQPAAAPSPALGSSYATFAVIGNYLYLIDYTSLVTLDISTPEEPEELSRTPIGWEIETLHPTDAMLFIGGTRGMYVLDRMNPAAPRMIGRIEHFRACDPVVVSGSIAYVTLRGGNTCGQARDVLLCVDIENPSAPLVVGEKPLVTPYGLAVREPFLYVSNGQAGFALVDVARPTEPALVGSWHDWATKDFIWAGDVLYVLGFDDLRIFDASDPRNPALIATIEPPSS